MKYVESSNKIITSPWSSIYFFTQPCTLISHILYVFKYILSFYDYFKYIIESYFSYLFFFTKENNEKIIFLYIMASDTNTSILNPLFVKKTQFFFFLGIDSSTENQITDVEFLGKSFFESIMTKEIIASILPWIHHFVRPYT